MEYACVAIFDNWMDRFECDGLHDEKWLRSWEEFDSLRESTSYMQLAVVQTADSCTYCLHTCAKAFAICSNQYEIPIWCEQEAHFSEIWTSCFGK